jgi:O-antigen/teichoic acid export membrane protein
MAAILAEYPRLTRRNAAVAIFPPLLLGATSLSAVPLWLGERQGAVNLVIIASAPGIAASVSTGVCAATLLAIGRAGIVGVAVLVSAAISAILAVPLGYAFGLEGIVLAFGGWMIAANLLMVAFLQSRVKIPMKTYLRAVGGPFAIGLCAAVPAVTVGLLANPYDRSSALVPFLLSSIVFSAIYASLGWRLGYLPRLRAAKGEAVAVGDHGKGET